VRRRRGPGEERGLKSSESESESETEA